MKVISEPSKEAWAHRHTCDRCESQLEIEVGDFTRTIHDQRDGSAAVVMCPTCGADQWIDLAVIPKALHHRLP